MPVSVGVVSAVTLPSAGVTITGAAGATVSMFQACDAGVASVLPAASVARTCEGVRARRQAAVVVRTRAGTPGAAVDAAIEGAAGLVGAELEARLLVLDWAGGATSIVVSGGVVSIVQP